MMMIDAQDDLELTIEQLKKEIQGNKKKKKIKLTM